MVGSVTMERRVSLILRITDARGIVGGLSARKAYRICTCAIRVYFRAGTYATDTSMNVLNSLKDFACLAPLPLFTCRTISAAIMNMKLHVGHQELDSSAHLIIMLEINFPDEKDLSGNAGSKFRQVHTGALLKTLPSAESYPADE